MKKLLILAAILSINFCHGQQFKINGNVSGLKCPSILLLKFFGDSTATEIIEVKNGIFTYSGSVKEPVFVQMLQFFPDEKKAEGKFAEFILENSNIEIKGSSPKYEDVLVSGSKSDLELNKYFKNSRKLKTNSEKVKLLKLYCKNNGNTIVGALLPTFCTLEDVLTTEDYRDIYAVLSDKMKQTAYGIKIKGKIK